MASTVLDSVLFRDAFGTPAMRAIFEDAALLSRYTEVEVALARAQAVERARKVGRSVGQRAIEIEQDRFRRHAGSTTGS